MEITRDTARYVAKLSRLELAEDEVNDVCAGLSSILSYMDEINASIDTDAVLLAGNAESGPVRPDMAGPSMDRGALLANAPGHGDETPVVPRVVD